jgi:hypothetical protein
MPRCSEGPFAGEEPHGAQSVVTQGLRPHVADLLSPLQGAFHVGQGLGVRRTAVQVVLQ